jgi:hypothetical protein
MILASVAEEFDASMSKIDDFVILDNILLIEFYFVLHILKK